MIVDKESGTRKISEEGAKKLRKNLQEYEQKRLEYMENLRSIKAQRSADDIGYQKILEELGYIENQIENISHCLLRAEIMKTGDSNGRVQIGSTVQITADTNKLELTIVDSMEANPLEGKISNLSPVGQALVGKGVNEDVYVATGHQTRQAPWKILNVS